MHSYIFITFFDYFVSVVIFSTYYTDHDKDFLKAGHYSLTCATTKHIHQFTFKIIKSKNINNRFESLIAFDLYINCD